MTSTTPGRGDALVLFGITGDLAKKMLLPALHALSRQRTLPERVIGVTHGGWSVRRLREHARESVAAHGPLDEDAFARLSDALRLATVDYDEPDSFRAIADEAEGCRVLVHYLAIPPSVYARAAELLARAGLNSEARLAVEKPFGQDLESARALQADLTQHFPEERLLRVDHFLGKDAVENLLTVRFANPALGEILHRRQVRGVQITLAEDFGVQDRGGFYDATGALRDVVQNHLLQTLAYFVMEPPRTGSPQDILDERARALRAVRTVLPEDYVRGQYTGYLDVPGVQPQSRAETYAALRTWVDTDRWSGVPFTIRTGKALATSAMEIVAELRRPTPGYYHSDRTRQAGPNLVRLRISPRPGAAFDLLAQQAADPTQVEPVTATADFTSLSGDDASAYQHILADALTGDLHRFTRMDMVEDSWRILGDILHPEDAPHPYPSGSHGPRQADRLATDHRWLPLSPG